MFHQPERERLAFPPGMNVGLSHFGIEQRSDWFLVAVPIRCVQLDDPVRLVVS
jgi:hypothetical protein